MKCSTSQGRHFTADSKSTYRLSFKPIRCVSKSFIPADLRNCEYIFLGNDIVKNHYSQIIHNVVE